MLQSHDVTAREAIPWPLGDPAAGVSSNFFLIRQPFLYGDSGCGIGSLSRGGFYKVRDSVFTDGFRMSLLSTTFFSFTGFPCLFYTELYAFLYFLGNTKYVGV